MFKGLLARDGRYVLFLDSDNVLRIGVHLESLKRVLGLRDVRLTLIIIPISILIIYLVLLVINIIHYCF